MSAEPFINSEGLNEEDGEVLASKGSKTASPQTVLYSSELSQDPVRLYLKEIGQIKLLNAESEFRLSTRNEAHNRMDWLKQRELDEKEKTDITAVFKQILADMHQTSTNLQLFIETNKGSGLPDFTLMLAEAQDLRYRWDMDEPSYTRSHTWALIGMRSRKQRIKCARNLSPVSSMKFTPFSWPPTCCQLKQLITCLTSSRRRVDCRHRRR